MKKTYLWIIVAVVALAALGIGWHYIWTSIPRVLPEPGDATAAVATTAAGENTAAVVAQSEKSFSVLNTAGAQEMKYLEQRMNAMAHPTTRSTAEPTNPTAQPVAPSQTATVREEISIVIPEGFTFYQVALRLEANKVCTAKAFYEAAQTYQVQSFQTPYSKDSCYYLEGYLYPDTYTFYKNDDAVAVLRKILNNYSVKSGLPDYQTLILASVIERETRSSEHMAMVSSVFHNRLAIGMRLQADATRAYVNEHIKPSWVANPEQYAARYNTYKMTGLPVGPICNPGRRAIEAAKNPAKSDYLYYFFGNDNTNHYTKTFEEHEAAMAQVGVNYG